MNATGLLAVPTAANPTSLVVFAHPFGTNATLFRTGLEQVAAGGALAVAMDYRGDHPWKVQAGANDTVAATLAVKAAWPSVNLTILYGWSMGGEVSGMAVAQAPNGTFDYWLDGAGVADLAATWQEDHAVQSLIEQETGGTPSQVPAAYSQRSPVDLAPQMASKGLQRAYLVYAPGDTWVSAEQAERLYQALASAGMHVTYYTVPTDVNPWACAPAVLVCGPEPPAGPASHEVGGLRLMMPLIQDRLNRVPDAADPAVRAVYEGITGTRT
ncbi:MAG: prolyl oligopeptidase family serine peptidase [bacterium]